MIWVAAGVGAMAACLITVLVLRAASKQRVSSRLDEARLEAALLKRAADKESSAQRLSVENEARETALEERTRLEQAIETSERKLAQRDDLLARRAMDIDALCDEVETRAAEAEERQRAVQSQRDRAAGLAKDIERRSEEVVGIFEERAGESSAAVVERLSRRWLEGSQAAAAQRLRIVEQTASDPRHDREAQRLMEVAISRYQNHFLTERNVSNLRVGEEVVKVLTANGGALHEVLQEVANTQLHVNESADAVRLEGLDGVGREVARRTLNKLLKKPESTEEALRDPRGYAVAVAEHVQREIRTLGKKAFQVLAVPRPHQEIVELVGALNYRTSYTQNQWLHAVEAAFLAGMMASELGLDVTLARRATLMHDIGKALTHKIEGSHAVIGADIARRLGEDEVVANAIGSHHADEPPHSPYAFLVAAADAMSGARPGARREMAEGFNHRIEDLERIGLRYQGVEGAAAVHGGRELRVYVHEGRVNDLRVVEMSTEIAEQISEEMTFPGQIKVTVIRSFEAVATAS